MAKWILVPYNTDGTPAEELLEPNLREARQDARFLVDYEGYARVECLHTYRSCRSGHLRAATTRKPRFITEAR